MKFLCPNCKAKYQIADEKVSGRTLRMDCRRCGHNITIRADMATDEADELEAKPSVRPPAGAARGGSVVGPNPMGAVGARPRAGLTGAHAPASAHPATGAGSALGADFRRNVGSAPEAASRTTPLDQWHVAINDVPVGPLRRDEIVKKIGAGAVTAESLCWREGLDDWRPLRDIPELAALLRRSLSPEPPARPGAARPPLAGAPPRAGAAAPAGRPGAATAARPAARSNVVPIGGRLGASAAPPLEEEDGVDEPTRVGSFDLAEFEAKAAAAEQEAKRIAEEAKAEAKLAEAKLAEARAAEARAVEARAAEAKAAEAKAAEAKRPPTGKITTKPVAPPPKPLGRPDTGKVPLAPLAKPGLQPPPKPAPEAEPEHEDELPIGEPVFAAAAPAVVAPEPVLAPAPAPAPAPLAAPPPAAPATVSARPEREERRGLPVGAWIGIAGAVAFGGVLAVMVGNHFLNAPVAPAVAAIQPPVTTAPPPTAAPTPPPTVAEVTPPPEAPPDQPPVVEPTPAEPATATGTTPRVRPAAGTGGTTPTAPAAGAGAGAATKAPTGRFADFADSPSGGGPAQIQTGPQRSLVDEAEGPARSGQSELTADQIRGVITRERPALNRCWESELRRLGQAATVRLDVDLSIGGSGTVTSVTTRGQSVGTLAECIERNVRRWRFPPVSGSTQTSFPLVFSGTE
jgi:predicted Zn finger-like uncharacterized protein